MISAHLIYGQHVFGRIIENCGPAKTIFGQNSGPAMAGPAGQPTTALSRRDCTICVAKTKTLISCAVTAQLISAVAIVFYPAAHFILQWL